MLWVSTAALCGAGRGAGTRATDGRLFAGRRRTGRATGLGTTGFFLAALLRMAGLFAPAGLPTSVACLCHPSSICPWPCSLPVARQFDHTHRALSHKGRGPFQFDIALLQQRGDRRQGRVTTAKHAFPPFFPGARIGRGSYHCEMRRDGSVLLTPGAVPLAAWRDIY